MSLVSFLSSLYLVFTIILLFKKKDMGNIYILFGVTTFVFVIGYGYIPSMPQQIQSFGIFIVFSIMILLFGLMFGIGLKLFNRSAGEYLNSNRGEVNRQYYPTEQL